MRVAVLGAMKADRKFKDQSKGERASERVDEKWEQARRHRPRSKKQDWIELIDWIGLA